MILINFMKKDKFFIFVINDDGIIVFGICIFIEVMNEIGIVCVVVLDFF